MGVQGNSPGKRERSRSDEENGGADFPKVHSLLTGGELSLRERLRFIWPSNVFAGYLLAEHCSDRT